MEEMNVRSFYLKEFELFDGEHFIKFNIIDINTDKMTIKLAITHTGKIIVSEYDLKRDKNNKPYYRKSEESSAKQYFRTTDVDQSQNANKKNFCLNNLENCFEPEQSEDSTFQGLYFEYNVDFSKIKIDDFEEIED